MTGIKKGIVEAQETGNPEFNTLVEVINKKILEFKGRLEPELHDDYDDVIKSLYGVITVLDGMLESAVKERELLVYRIKSDGKKIITLNS